MNNKYYKSNGFEVIEIIEAFNLSFCLGNVIKYVLRAGRKTENKIDDLKKAVDYLNYAIERETNNITKGE